MKKAISKKILIMLLICMISIPTYAKSTDYTDITGGEWFYNDLDALTQLGIIQGTSDGSFLPNNLLTKDALVKTLVVSTGNDPGNATNYWAQNYIDTADSYKWLDGIEGPYNDSINRYEACVLIVNALSQEENVPSDLTPYQSLISDFDIVPDIYKQSLLTVYALGIITGYPDGSFGGNNTLIRSEMVAILSRYMNPINRKVPTIETSSLNINSTSDRIDADDLSFLDTPNSPAVRDGLMKYSAPDLMYYNSQTKQWVTIAQSGLTFKTATFAEQCYVDVANYVVNKTDYSVTTKYGYGNYYMYVADEFTPVISVSIDDSQDQVSINLPELAIEPYNKLSDDTTEILKIILSNVSASDQEALYKHLKENFFFIQDGTNKTIIQDYDTFESRILNDINGFKVLITFK